MRYDPPMHTASFAPLRGIARGARAWLLWLALALAAAHSVATWHAYSHSPAERVQQNPSTDQHGGATWCGLCLAIAGIGGAAPGPVNAQLPVLSAHQQLPVPAVREQQLPSRRPYAIRAPPVLHS
jgi:hypothetical protein